MASFHTNKTTQCDENEASFVAHTTSSFSTDMVFKSRQELFDWVQKVGRSLGYAIVTKRSKKLPSGTLSKVFLMCDRGGMSRSKSSNRKRGSKKTNCPFELVGKYMKMHDVWTLRVICEEHNHEPIVNMEGHPYAMRLSADETSLVYDLSRKNVKPQDILSTLKEQNRDNVSTIKTIHNACQKFRKTQQAETFMRQVINSDEGASPSLVDTFDANKLKRTIDHTDSFAIKNCMQELDSTKYAPVTKDIEDLLPRKQNLMPAFLKFPLLQSCLKETNHVKDVSIANPVRHDVVMYHDVNDQYTNAPVADDELASARPFQPCDDAVFNNPEGQFLVKQSLRTNYYYEGQSNNSGDTAGMVLIGAKSPGGTFSESNIHSNKSNQGVENEGNIGVHNASAFSTDMVFKTRQDLFTWVKKVGRSLGYVIVTKRTRSRASGVIFQVILMCDRGGTSRSKSSVRKRGTKKTNCPFELVGKYMKKHDVWTLRVICEKHNHEPALHLEGHPYAMRLSANESHLVFELSKKNVKPQAILSELKEKNKDNMSMLKTIYNARHKFRRIQHAETCTRQVVNNDENESSSLENTAYVFGVNMLKESIGHTDPFSVRNCVYELDPAGPENNESTDRENKKVDSDAEVEIKHDKGEYVAVQSNSDTEENDSQYDVNFDGLADIWEEMTVGLESSKDANRDLSVNQFPKEDQECDHSFILKEDIGYVCRVCGLIKRGIESVIEFQLPKTSKTSKTSYNEGRSDTSGDRAAIILDGVKLPGQDFSVVEVSAHPRHRKQMKPHQVEGFNFLLSNLVSENPGGCILAHAPGSGKTFMLISFIQSFMAKYPDARPLVVLPRGILTTWKKEFKRWQVEDIPLFDCYSQKADNRAQQLEVLKQWANTRSILFLGYKQFSTIVCDNGRSSAAATCREILLTFPSLVILDEGHTPRNKDTDVFTSLEKVQTPRKVVLSGTLYQNHVWEVFNVLNLVRPRFLRMEDSKAIKRRILSRVLIETQRNMLKKSTDNEFYELVEHTLLRDDNFRRKVTVIQDLREMTRKVLHYYKGDFLDELPGHVDFSVFLNLSPRQKQEVLELKKLARKFKISSDGSAIYVHPDLKSLVKTITQDKNDDDTIKIDEILEKLDEGEGVKAKFFLNVLRLCTLTGEKLLVFGQYLLPLNFLLRLTMKVKGWRLNKEIFMITGDHNNEEREVAMDQFNHSSDAKVFFGSVKACGEGISLVGASRIIILDVHLNPSVTRQAIGRAFRPGQVRKVYTYRLVAAGSPEEEDHTTCHRKESIAKMWFEYNEYCGQNEFEMEKIDIKDCGDHFLETPWLNEDVTALYKR